MMRWLPLAIATAVATQRLIELRRSKANEHRLRAAGGREVLASDYPAMVTVHSAMLAGTAIEGTLRGGPGSAAAVLPWAAVFAGAGVLRVWALSTLGDRWNVKALATAGQPISRSGPYRWIRHPNYLAVILEMVSAPMMANAPLTAVLASGANAVILYRRVGAEEALLAEQSDYAIAFDGVARFVPGVL